MEEVRVFNTLFDKIDYYFNEAHLYTVEDLYKIHNANSDLLSLNEIEAILSKNPALTEEENRNRMLAACKKDKIDKSKSLLKDWLKNNPLISSCHGNKTAAYNVTAEKQTLFHSAFSAYKALKDAGLPATFSWNAIGEPSEEWSEEECVAFINEMNIYIHPRVVEQQYIEKTINECNTLEDVYNVTIDYYDLPFFSSISKQ